MTVEIIIKEIREKEGITIDNLSRDTGISKKRLSDIENGNIDTSKILFVEMLLIAQNLGKKITDIYRTGEIVVVRKDWF